MFITEFVYFRKQNVPAVLELIKILCMVCLGKLVESSKNIYFVHFESFVSSVMYLVFQIGLTWHQ